MSDVKQFSPFFTLQEIEQNLNPAVNTLFQYHWRRLLKTPWTPLYSLLTKNKFSKFWCELIEEICKANHNTAAISEQTKIPLQLLNDLRSITNSNNIFLSIDDVEKLIIFHSKARPDLQPKQE